MYTVFVHINKNGVWENSKHEFKHIPHTNDAVSFTANGPIYKIDETLFNCFDCDYEVELFVHQIRP